jgi:hypothetical protein
MARSHPAETAPATSRRFSGAQQRPDLYLVQADAFLELSICEIGVVERRVELVNVQLQLLAHAHCLRLRLALRLDGALHLLHHLPRES